MPDEKHPYEAINDAPIPTYEEATSSRYPPSPGHFGPQEVSDDAERQGLLRHGSDVSGFTSGRRDGYQQPTVQSVRSSLDSDLALPEMMGGSDDEDAEEEEELRRELHEMDIEDDAAESSRRRRALMRSTLSKRISSLTTTLSSLHLPRFRIPMPSFRFVTDRVRFRMPSVSERYRPSWPIVARLMGLFLVVSLVYAVFISEMFPGMQPVGLAQAFNPEWVRSFAQEQVSIDRIRENLRYATSYDHIAGTKGSYTLGRWIEGRFKQSGMDGVDLEEYQVYLNYPSENGRKVSIVEPADMAWEAKLEEEPAYKNGSPDIEQSTQQTQVFHGMSKSGTAKGPLIYANYGSREDFKRLADSHINVEGAIILVRAGGRPRDTASKVKAAQEAGAAGCLIYTDPAEDGFVRGKTWPNGRWRPEDSVERGSVALSSYIVGDVLTPGEASQPAVVRSSKEDNPGLVKIPSLPLAWRDAQHLLQALKGHGDQLPEEWIGGVPEIDEWWSGNEQSPIVQLQNEQTEEEKQPIYNVIGYIRGIETHLEKVIIGNHRDSWCFGAADPGSGTAVMIEVANVLGLLHAQGWRPLRSIVFASWDASEYNFIGSTEFVEDHIDDLRTNGVAYLNVDTGVSGSELHVAGSPVLERTFHRILGRVSDPVKNKTFAEIWDNSPIKMEGLGGDSDYIGFQDLAGVSSLDFGFKGEGLPYHSCYETYEWMNRYGDPDLHYHKALTEIWVLLILELSQEPIIPFNMKDFAESVTEYISDLQDYAVKHGAPLEANEEGVAFDISPLSRAAQQMEQETANFQMWEDQWYSHVVSSGGFESHSMAVHRVSHNSRKINFEKHLLDWPWDNIPVEGVKYGIPGREQYKHVIFGPDTQDASASNFFFPAVRDAIQQGQWSAAQEQVNKAANILHHAGHKLVHNN